MQSLHKYAHGKKALELFSFSETQKQDTATTIKFP